MILVPMPLLAQRYRLLPDELALAAGIAVVLLTIVSALTRARVRVHLALWSSVAFVLVLDLYSVFSLLRIIAQAGNDLRGGALLLSAIQVWLANVAGFALLYWFLNEVLRPAGTRPWFLFTDPETERHSIVDYLFVAGTTALAFGPTDTPPATTIVRCAMLVQAVVSFVIVALVAARAINAIG